MTTGRKLLDAHQREWNDIKKEAIESGKSEEDIDDLYIKYLGYLTATRHWFFGACFPRE